MLAFSIIVYCRSGYERKTGSCVACGIGYYKDNSVDLFSSCVKCPSDYVTSGIASTSIVACGVRKYLSGERKV